MAWCSVKVHVISDRHSVLHYWFQLVVSSEGRSANSESRFIIWLVFVCGLHAAIHLAVAVAGNSLFEFCTISASKCCRLLLNDYSLHCTVCSRPLSLLLRLLLLLPLLLLRPLVLQRIRIVNRSQLPGAFVSFGLSLASFL